MPMTYAGGFSISMCCRLLLFLPAERIDAAFATSAAVGLVAAGIVGINTTCATAAVPSSPRHRRRTTTRQ